MTTVAVLGTGKMGAGMARQLAEHGHEVRVWNRSRDRAEELADVATVADDPAGAVDGADVLLTMVFDADAVVDVLNQAEPGLSERTVLVQSTTVGLDIDRVAAEAERLGLAMLDAPVVGTRQPAEQGTLTVLASGDPRLREVADPVLDAIGARTVWAGDEVGAASRLKLAANAWLAALTVGTAQSLALAEGLGLDPSLFLQVIDGTPVDSPYAQLKGKMMVEGRVDPAFTVDGLRKDLDLIAASAHQAGIAADLVEAEQAAFGRVSAAGHGGDDIAAVRSAF